MNTEHFKGSEKSNNTFVSNLGGRLENDTRGFEPGSGNDQDPKTINMTKIKNWASTVHPKCKYNVFISRLRCYNSKPKRLWLNQLIYVFLCVT